MSIFLQFALILAFILLAAKLAGYLSTLLHQPSVLGELLVGLLLGPSQLNLLNLPGLESAALEEMLHHLAELGVMLLMFLAGLELHFSELARNIKVSALAGVFGVVLPVALGWGLGQAAGFDPQAAVFLGLTLGATSVSISAQTLMELRVLRSRVGLSMLGAAVFDDVLVILLLSTFLALAGGGSSLFTVVWIFLRMVIFLGLSAALGWRLLPWLAHRVVALPISQGLLTLAVVVMLVYGVAAEVVGRMAAITGAFIAGLIFSHSAERDRLERGMNSLAYGLFVPVFFVNVGLSVDARQLSSGTIWLFVGIVIIAILGKVVGAGAGALLGGLTMREALQLGAGMVSRGEVGLILASVGYQEGMIDPVTLSSIVGMVLVTTLVTPPMLRALFIERPSVPKKA